MFCSGQVMAHFDGESLAHALTMMMMNDDDNNNENDDENDNNVKKANFCSDTMI